MTGIEMTAYARGEVVHVLGLGISARNDALARANAIAMSVWSANQKRWVQSLGAEGFRLSSDLVADRPVRLPILIERLCSRGVDGGDPRRCYERFKAFFAALPPEAYAELPSPAAAARAVRDAGGIAVLAHPERLRSRGLVEALMGDVDGIEALYGPYDQSSRDALVKIARSHDKFYTCGSDYHGFFNGAYINPRLEASPALLARLGLLDDASS